MSSDERVHKGARPIQLVKRVQGSNGMAQFNDWCNCTDSVVGNHSCKVLTEQAANRQTGVNATASIIPGHYASEERVARALARMGKQASAEVIQGKLPTSKQIRSGDLGEIYATEWIDSLSGGFRALIKRLRWKDHRNMAMRGDDVIGILQDPATQRLRFLKTEAKSRVTLSRQVLEEARVGLDKDGGLPSAHALAFVAERLLETGNLAWADAIDDAQLIHGIQPQEVQHLLFTFSGNAPLGLLTNALQDYPGQITQRAVGLHVQEHALFVSAVYDQVIVNANND